MRSFLHKPNNMYTSAQLTPYTFHILHPLLPLTHWGRVTHISLCNLTIVGSDNGLSPGRRQAITWTNVEILLIGPLGTNFSEMLIEIHTFSFKKIHLKISSGKWRPFCLGLSLQREFHFKTSPDCYGTLGFLWWASWCHDIRGKWLIACFVLECHAKRR